MFALVETAKKLLLFKNEKIQSKYKFDDIFHAQKIYSELIKGKMANEIVDFLLENDVDKIIVDKSLLKLNKNEELKEIQFIENHIQIRLLKEKIKIDHKSTRGLSHVIAQKNVNFFTNDPLIIQSYALYKQIELDMEKYDKRALEIYLNYLPELKIKKRQSKGETIQHISFDDDSVQDSNLLLPNLQCHSKAVAKGTDSKISSDSSHDNLDEIQFKDQFDIEVIEKLWKIKERNDHNYKWVFTSVGMDLSDADWRNLERIIALFNLKKENSKNLKKYFLEKLKEHSPNLLALLGFKLTAEIISLTGSLLNLSKCTAGTVQVLGAEKALFRSLKSKTPTPKYGILKNNDITSSPRIIRSLANKIVICARIDAFSKIKTDLYGVALKQALIKKVNQNVQIDTEEILRAVSQTLHERYATSEQSHINPDMTNQSTKYNRESQKIKRSKYSENENADRSSIISKNEEFKKKKLKSSETKNEINKSSHTKKRRRSEKNTEDIQPRESHREKKRSKKKTGNNE